MAYQDWLRPLSVSTLTSVETAGIPVEDRLVEAGGRHKRTVAQLGHGTGRAQYVPVSLRADHLRVRNPGTVGVDLRTPSRCRSLEEMRNVQLVNLSSHRSAGRHAQLRRWHPARHWVPVSTICSTGAGRAYSQVPAAPGQRKPYLRRAEPVNPTLQGAASPTFRATPLVLGATWVSPQRFYVSGRAVYRSERFEDKENLTRMAPGWMDTGPDGFLGIAGQTLGGGRGSALNLWCVRSPDRQKDPVCSGRALPLLIPGITSGPGASKQVVRALAACAAGAAAGGRRPRSARTWHRAGVQDLRRAHGAGLAPQRTHAARGDPGD